MLNCAVDHILQEFYTRFLTIIRTYKIASPPQTKMTSKDDIKGLVSLSIAHGQGDSPAMLSDSFFTRRTLVESK